MLSLFFKDLAELYLSNPIGQTFGFFAMFTILYWFVQTDDKKSKNIIKFALILWIAHFYFMWLMVACIATIIAMVRVALSIKFERNIYICGTLVLLSLVLWFISFKGSLVESLPIVTSVIWTINFFYFHWIIFRAINMFNSSCWLVFYAYVGSIWWAMNEFLTIFILSITIIRLMTYDGYFHKYKLYIDRIMHKHEHIDYWHFAIVDDTHKVIRKEWYMHLFFRKLKETYKKYSLESKYVPSLNNN
jgi:hypothetical protein